MLKLFKIKTSNFSHFYSIKPCIHITTYVHKVKMFVKVINIYLYINQKKTQQKIS